MSENSETEKFFAKWSNLKGFQRLAEKGTLVGWSVAVKHYLGRHQTVTLLCQNCPAEMQYDQKRGGVVPKFCGQACRKSHARKQKKLANKLASDAASKISA